MEIDQVLFLFYMMRIRLRENNASEGNNYDFEQRVMMRLKKEQLIEKLKQAEKERNDYYIQVEELQTSLTKEVNANIIANQIIQELRIDNRKLTNLVDKADERIEQEHLKYIRKIESLESQIALLNDKLNDFETNKKCEKNEE